MSDNANNEFVCGVTETGCKTDCNRLHGLFIHTFGCQLNEYDSEKVFMLLSEHYRPVFSIEEASVVFINSCSVRHKAEHKLYGLLGKLELEKQKRPDLIIGVGGCVAQQEGERILRRFSKVDFVVGTHNISQIPELIKKAKQSGNKTLSAKERINQALSVNMKDSWEKLPLSDEFGVMEKHGAAFGAYYSPTRAFVAIQRGCNNKCAYCVVPHTRGPEISRDFNEIIEEITEKTKHHPKEVMLLGTTVNSYGGDLLPSCSFAELVKRVAELPNVLQIRFTSPHPRLVSDEFIDLYQSIPKLAPHIHLPLQSGSNRILKLMNRGYTREQYFDIVTALKEKRPELSISTDLIVGFPTETEAEFEDTLDVIRRVNFCASYSFCYSERPNTSAFGRYDKGDMVDNKVSLKRLSILQKLQNELSLSFNKNYVGTKTSALIEGEHKHNSLHLRGRTPQNVLIKIELEKELGYSIIAKPIVNEVCVISATPHCIKGVMR